MKSVPIWMAVGLAATVSLQAVVIDGFSAERHNRFAGTFPSAPVPNTSASFIGDGYDWSGVGWDAGLATRNIALISSQYFVFATHYAPGSTLHFFSPTLYAANPGNPAAAVVSYTWNAANTYTFQLPGAPTISDFAVGRLDTPINSAHGLASYPILNLGSLVPYLGLELLVYGFSSATTSPTIGRNVVDGFEWIDVRGGDNQDETFAVFHFDENQADSAAYQGGDSGGPLFSAFQGELALVGTHSAVGTSGGKWVNFDNFIPVYLDQMFDRGITFETVPEVPALGVAALLGLLSVGYCRRFRA